MEELSQSAANVGVQVSRTIQKKAWHLAAASPSSPLYFWR